MKVSPALGKAAVFAAVCFIANPAGAVPWWHTYTPIVTAHANLEEVTGAGAGVIRGAGYYGGWYGFWYLDSQESTGWACQMSHRVARAGMKEILYYDLGEVGDYAGFFAPDGRMKCNGWTLPKWKGEEPLTARWFGLEAFMKDVPLGGYSTAKAYGLPPFTMPDGKASGDFYSMFARRGLNGKWKYDYSSNPGVTDDLARSSGLAGISEKQEGRAEMQGKTGWQTVRLVDVDYANPQLRDFCSREIARLVAKIKPAGVHADNFGDANLGCANTGAFGMWAVDTFRGYLRGHFTSERLKEVGIADPATFDITAYVRSKHRDLRSAEWTSDPVWLAYLIHLVECSQSYHRSFYAAAKKAAKDAGGECAVFGNTIPLPLGGSLMAGACDIAHFEWSTSHGWWGMRPMGLPPKGRLGYVVRLGAAISEAPFCWPSLYVDKDMSGKGHENLHKALAFDALANHGLLDYGNWFLDGYSPGTVESAKFINRFVTTHAAEWGRRRFPADIAVVHSAWSEIASCTLSNPLLDMFADEYCGWCRFLGDTHRQWDVVLQKDLTTENLARFPVVVLPSVMVLTDEQTAELRRYVELGGHLVATGLAGTRYGPEQQLALRGANALSAFATQPSVHMTTGKPGVAYWREEACPDAAREMAALLDWPDVRPSLETGAPETVGVNLNLCTGNDGEILTVDFNNCDLDVATDTLRPVPVCETMVRLPKGWRNPRITWSTPEMEASPVELPADQWSLDSADGTLHLKTPSFATFLLVTIRPEISQATSRR